MEASINLLSSSSSFPLRTHFRNTPAFASSVPVLNEQTSTLTAVPATSTWKQLPASVLSHEQREECKPTSTLRDHKAHQLTLERQMIEEVEFLQKHMGFSVRDLQYSEHELYHSPGLSDLLTLLGNAEHSMSGDVSYSTNAESCNAISLASEALSASRIASSLAGSETNDDDLDASPSQRMTDNFKVKPTVRSTRCLERKMKKRKSSKPRANHETGSPVKAEPKRSSVLNHNDPLRMFLSGPEKKQLLTLQEESVLIRDIQDFHKLVVVKEQLQSQFEREPTIYEWANAVGLSSGTLSSKLHSWKRNREKVIYANFRMVVYIAKQYQGRGLSLQDLMQEGSMGLMKSLEKFKPQAGCRFSSYAYWWIRQSVKKAVFQHSKMIRVPETMYALLGKVLEAKKTCIQEGIRNPTNEELAKHAGITVEKLCNVMTLMSNPVSMQQPIFADQSTTFQVAVERALRRAAAGDCSRELEVTADTKIENPSISVEKQLMRKHMRNLLGILTPKEQKIIKLRFGIGSTSGKQYSLSEIGVMFGLSKERVRQLESRALNTLKESLSSHGLNSYTELLI